MISSFRLEKQNDKHKKERETEMKETSKEREKERANALLPTASLPMPAQGRKPECSRRWQASNHFTCLSCLCCLPRSVFAEVEAKSHSQLLDPDI